MTRILGLRTKFARYSTLLVLVGLALGLTIAGCSGGGGSTAPAQVGGGQPPAPTTAGLILDLELEGAAARQVPADVTQVRITGYDQAGNLAYGPEVRAKAARIVLEDVPVEVASIRLELLRGDGTIAGLYEEAVDLQPGATKVIADPAWEDFNNPPSLSRIEVSPAATSVAAGIGCSFTAVAVFNDNSRQILTEDATWVAGAPNIATVSNAAGTKGQAKGLAQGATTIQATYAGVVGAADLTVTAAELVSIEVDPAVASIPAGRTQQFTATGKFTDDTTADITNQVTWSSDDTGVATIENVEVRAHLANGVVPGRATGVAFGSTTIKATHQATGKFGTAELGVTQAELVSIAVTPTNASVPKGNTLKMTATGTFSDNSTRDITEDVGLNWESSDDAIASINNLVPWKGQASAHAVGAVTVKATDSATGIFGETQLTVGAAELVSLAVTPTNPSVPLGVTQQFLATGTYTDNSLQDLTAQVTWGSSDQGKATISNDPANPGLATPAAVGQTTISATDPQSGKSGNTQMTVTPARLVSIQVTPVAPSIAKGRNQQFTATGTFSDTTTRDLTQEVTWSSSAAGVATISNAAGTKGLALGAGVGQTNITATDPATQVQGSTTLDVTKAELVSLAVTPPTSLLPLGNNQQLTCTGTYSDNTTQNLTGTVTWSSADGGIATVSNVAATKGLVTPVALGGPIAMRATDPGTGLFAEANVEVVAAALASIAVTPVNPSVAKGRTQQFTATGTFSDQSTRDLTDEVAWTSSDLTVATITSDVPGRVAVPNIVDGGGLATTLKVGQTTITASYPGTQISGNTTLTVTNAELVSLAVRPVNPSVAKGRGEPFAVTGTFTDNSTRDMTEEVTWSSSNEAVATISNEAGTGLKGFATSVSVGQTTIKATDPATQISDSTTLTVTAAELVSIAVTPANPSVEQNKTQQFTATGTFTDTSTQDLTNTVTWSTASGAIATISNADGSKGLATGAGIGQTTVIATDPGTSIAGNTNLTVTEPPPPQLTVIYRNKCGTAGVPPEVAGLQVKWTNQDTGAIVTGNLDANGQAVFTRDQITTGVTWEVKVVAGASGCGSSTARLGCWDGTHNNWGQVGFTGEAAGTVSVYMACPNGCGGIVPPPPPFGYDAAWGNQTGCPGG